MLISALCLAFLDITASLSEQHQIDLQNNSLDAIPFNRLETSLKTIELHKNRITNIPEHAFSNYTNLRSLWLSDNLIHTIHETALVGTKLANLSVHTNNLTTLLFVKAVNMTLERIELHNNRITEISDHIFSGSAKLSFIELSDNQIHTIHESAFEGTALGDLRLRNNHLSNLSFVNPIQKTLFRIWLHKNRITEIPEYAFYDYTKLLYLHIPDNQIHTIHVTAFEGTNLRRLGLHNNNISTLSFVKPVQKNLEYLHVSNNPLLKLPSSFNFSHFKNLKKLYIHGTAITKLPDLGTQVPTLEHLNIGNMGSLKCDCRLAWLKGHRGISNVHREQHPCKNDCHLNNKLWDSIEVHELQCHGKCDALCVGQKISHPAELKF